MKGSVYFFQIIINGAILWGLILALGALFRDHPDKKITRIFAAFAAAQSLALIPITLFNYNILIKNPLFNSILSIIPLFIGPLYYLYFKAAFKIGSIDLKKNIKHFSIIPLYFIGILIMYICVKDLYTHESFDYETFYYYKRWFIGFQFFHIVLYYICTIKTSIDGIIQKKDSSDIKTMKLVIIFTVLYLIAISIALLAIIFSGSQFPRITIMMSFVFMMTIITCHYVVSQRYPILMAFNDKIIKRQGTLDESDILFFENLNNRILDSMTIDKIYRSEELTIAMLANELSVQPWQLSKFFNSYLKQNFSSFINFYRIREARHLLIHEPDKNILTIAFEVGFNSKSSFNRVFQKSEKLTPTDFRALHNDMRERYY